MRWEDYQALSAREQAVARFWFAFGLLEAQAQAVWWQMLLGACGYTWDPDSGRFVAQM